MTAFQPGSPAYEAVLAERDELRADNARLREENQWFRSLVADMLLNLTDRRKP